MIESLYPVSLILPSVLICLVFCWVIRNSRNHIPKYNKVLDQVCMVTSLLLAILYVPLSVTGFFLGMVGEAFINTGTPLQVGICDFVGFLGVSTPVAAYGGLVVAYILRKRELSLRGFLYQFSGLIYLAVLLIISEIPFWL